MSGNGNGHGHDRREPRLVPEPVSVDGEMLDAAFAEARKVFPQFGLEAAIACAVRTALAVQQEASRRGTTAGIEGIHVADVAALERVLVHQGGGLLVGEEGPRVELACARAIKAVDDCRRQRAARERERYRHRQQFAQRTAAEVAQRMAARSVVSGRQP